MLSPCCNKPLTKTNIGLQSSDCKPLYRCECGKVMAIYHEHDFKEYPNDNGKNVMICVKEDCDEWYEIK